MSNRTFIEALFIVYVVVLLMFIATAPAFADVYGRAAVVVEVNYI